MYSKKEMIHWNHTLQVQQKPVSEAIFLFSLHSPSIPSPKWQSEDNQLYLIDGMLNPGYFHIADVALMKVNP
jgi:hypothetical protein